jgi:hypothetical protein
LAGLNHVDANPINTELLFPKLLANRTYGGHRGIDAIDPSRTLGLSEASCVPFLFGPAARPGGNVTGVTQTNLEVAPKRLELLHELLPTARVMALLVNPAEPTIAETTSLRCWRPPALSGCSSMS